MHSGLQVLVRVYPLLRESLAMFFASISSTDVRFFDTTAIPLRLQSCAEIAILEFANAISFATGEASVGEATNKEDVDIPVLGAAPVPLTRI